MGGGQATNLEDLHSLGPSSAGVSRDSGLVAGVLALKMGPPPSQLGALRHSREACREHVLNPPLDRKGSSYFDILFLPQRLPLEQHCIYC